MSVSWQDHVHLARARDCQLASIASKEEQAMILKLSEGVESALWIGGKYIGEGSPKGKTGDAFWEWHDGSKWIYENWNVNTGPSNELGECVWLQPPSVSVIRDWDNQDCSRTRAAVYKCCG